MVMAMVAAGAGAFMPARAVAAAQPKVPGNLVSSEVVAAPGLNGTAYRVQYWSESVPANKLVKVTGLIVVPNGTPPTGGWPVVSWAHPTDGLVGNCAPSLDPTTAVPFANDLLAQGWEITATDYLHENAYHPTSKQLLPYVLGEDAARDTIDVVRAARRLPAADASSTYQVWGWSEGGQTALWASDIAQSYASELNLAGVVATAAPSQLTGAFWSHFVSDPIYWPLLLAMVAGLNHAYKNQVAPLKEMLTKLGRQEIAADIKVEPQCVTGIIENLAFTSSYNATFVSPSISPAWQSVIGAQDPANFTAAGPAPVLLMQGTADALVPPSTSATLAGQLCALSPPQPLERWLYTGLDHTSIIGAQTPGTANANGNGDSLYSSSSTFADVTHWMSDRFAGGSWPDTYTPTGAGVTPVTQTDVC